MATPFSAAGQIAVYKGTLTHSPPGPWLRGIEFTAENTEVGVLRDDGLGDKRFFAKPRHFQEWEGNLCL